MALAHLHAAGIAWSPGLPSVDAASPDERRVLAHQLETGLACTPTSSMGRLYDAVSSLVGARHRIEYDAQAAIDLETAARRAVDAPGSYTFAVPDDLGAVSCAPVVRAVVDDVTAGVSPDLVAVRFHRAVVGLVVDVATRAREREQVGEVTLSGGVFVNTLLTTWCTRAPARTRLRGAPAPARAPHRRRPGPRPGRHHAHSPEVEPHAHDESAVEPRETERTCV
jgi:hydrogenase maturation protein HypF